MPVQLSGREEFCATAGLSAGDLGQLAKGVVLLVELQVFQHTEGLRTVAASIALLWSILHKKGYKNIYRFWISFQINQ